MAEVKKFKQWLPGKQLGLYVNAIKKKQTQNQCALSLLFEATWEAGCLPTDEEFWADGGPISTLIKTFEENKSFGWDAVLKFILE